MMQMQFTRLGRQRRGHHSLPDGASAADLAVGQLLGMANGASFRFDVIDGRLVIVSANGDWERWPALRACLDDIGVDAIIGYFERNTPERRAALSATA